MSKTRLLIIEDEALNRDALERLLQDDYALLFAQNAETGWHYLDTHDDVALVLLDLNLPGIDGLELLKRIRTEVRFNYLPIVIITGMTSEDDETKGLEAGAWDYIHKPFRPAAVKLRIANQLMLSQQRKELEQLAIRDHLTGLYNRRGFDDIFQRELARAKRSGAALSIALIDVDHFKQYNDHYGHPEGDKVLKLVAKQLDSVTRRAADLAARVGGEEFMLLWPETGPLGAQQQAQKLCRSIEQLAQPHAASEVSNYLTISIGGITLEAGDYDARTALQNVDEALYEAKRSGRNRVKWYGAD